MKMIATLISNLSFKEGKIYSRQEEVYIYLRHGRECVLAFTKHLGAEVMSAIIRGEKPSFRVVIFHSEWPHSQISVSW